MQRGRRLNVDRRSVARCTTFDAACSTILPGQFRPRTVPEHPIRNLVAAVLRTLTEDLDGRNMRWRRNPKPWCWEAWEWMLDDDPGPWGFVWCCHVVGLDVDATRRALAVHHPVECDSPLPVPSPATAPVALLTTGTAGASPPPQSAEENASVALVAQSGALPVEMQY
jgi:hypothetical protein